MKIAVLSDIHGNLGALDAVLDDIGRRGADLTVNLGDILSGPLEPRATAERLMALDLPTIRGNHERQLLADAADIGASDRFARDALAPRHVAWLETLPGYLWVTPDVFMCHATPTSDVACYLEDIRNGELVPTSLANIDERTGDCAASLILCGHTHIPRIAQLPSGQIIVNPGSVGIQAYDGHHPAPHRVEVGSPHARYALIEGRAGDWSAALIAVPYDWNSAADLAASNARDDWHRALRRGFL